MIWLNFGVSKIILPKRFKSDLAVWIKPNDFQQDLYSTAIDTAKQVHQAKQDIIDPWRTKKKNYDLIIKIKQKALGIITMDSTDRSKVLIQNSWAFGLFSKSVIILIRILNEFLDILEHMVRGVRWKLKQTQQYIRFVGGTQAVVIYRLLTCEQLNFNYWREYI